MPRINYYQLNRDLQTLTKVSSPLIVGILAVLTMFYGTTVSYLFSPALQALLNHPLTKIFYLGLILFIQMYNPLAALIALALTFSAFFIGYLMSPPLNNSPQINKINGELNSDLSSADLENVNQLKRELEELIKDRNAAKAQIEQSKENVAQATNELVQPVPNVIESTENAIESAGNYLKNMFHNLSNKLGGTLAVEESITGWNAAENKLYAPLKLNTPHVTTVNSLHPLYLTPSQAKLAEKLNPGFTALENFSLSFGNSSTCPKKCPPKEKTCGDYGFSINTNTSNKCPPKEKTCADYGFTVNTNTSNKCPPKEKTCADYGFTTNQNTNNTNTSTGNPNTNNTSTVNPNTVAPPNAMGIGNSLNSGNPGDNLPTSGIGKPTYTTTSSTTHTTKRSETGRPTITSSSTQTTKNTQFGQMPLDQNALLSGKLGQLPPELRQTLKPDASNEAATAEILTGAASVFGKILNKVTTDMSEPNRRVQLDSSDFQIRLSNPGGMSGGGKMRTSQKGGQMLGCLDPTMLGTNIVASLPRPVVGQICYPKTSEYCRDDIQIAVNNIIQNNVSTLINLLVAELKNNFTEQEIQNQLCGIISVIVRNCNKTLSEFINTYETRQAFFQLLLLVSNRVRNSVGLDILNEIIGEVSKEMKHILAEKLNFSISKNQLRISDVINQARRQNVDLSRICGSQLQSSAVAAASSARPNQAYCPPPPPGTCYGAPPALGYGSGSASGYGTGVTNGTGSISGYGMGSSSGYGTGVANGYGMGSSSGYGTGVANGYGMGSSSGYETGLVNGYGTGSASGFGMTDANRFATESVIDTTNGAMSGVILAGGGANGITFEYNTITGRLLVQQNGVLLQDAIIPPSSNSSGWGTVRRLDDTQTLELGQRENGEYYAIIT